MKKNLLKQLKAVLLFGSALAASNPAFAAERSPKTKTTVPHEQKTQFTVENTAIILIDHQVGTMNLIKNIDVNRAKKMAIALAKTAKALKIPVVLTSSLEDRAQGPLLPEMKEILPEAYEKRIKRRGIVNAWSDPAFRKAIQDTGRKNLIMAGVTTDVCLIFPSIDAAMAGYNVQAVMDASGSPFDMSEEFARKRMENAGVVLTATNTLLAELAQDWTSAEGQAIHQIMAEIIPKM